MLQLKLNSTIYKGIKSKKGQIAILVDPDKFNWDTKKDFVEKIKFSKVDYIFVGGSTVEKCDLEKTVEYLKVNIDLPIVLFPGDVHQYHGDANALLYLSLLSGRNSEYLIGQHVRTSKDISKLDIEVIPTAYLLIDGGNPSAVAYVSQTTPIPQTEINLIESTVMAGILQGKSMIYLDAGSGAKNSISPEIIQRCADLDCPLIVGGGIRSIDQIKSAQDAGANVIVIGNYIEENIDFLLDISNLKENKR